jgi:hypothetical protein
MDDEIQFFPFKAYPQQNKLMKFLVNSLLRTKNVEDEDDNSPKIILIESPTGTGKTMMILSSLMEYLNRINNKEGINDDNKDGNNTKDDDDWLNDFGKNEKEQKLDDGENKIKKINEKMDFIMSNIKKKIQKNEKK